MGKEKEAEGEGGETGKKKVEKVKKIWDILLFSSKFECVHPTCKVNILKLLRVTVLKWREYQNNFPVYWSRYIFW